MIWNATAISPEVGSTETNVSMPLKLPLYSAIGMSRCGTGTLKRVPATTYSLFMVVNGDGWLPAMLGISMISTVSNVVRSMRAMRGVLLPLMKIQRPSGTPLVMENSGW